MHPNEPSKGMSSTVESTAPYQITLTMYPDGKVAVSEPSDVSEMKEMKGQEDDEIGYDKKMSEKGHMGGDKMEDSAYGKKFASMDKAMKYMMSADMGENKEQESMMHQGYNKSMGASDKMDEENDKAYA